MEGMWVASLFENVIYPLKGPKKFQQIQLEYHDSELWGKGRSVIDLRTTRIYGTGHQNDLILNRNLFGINRRQVQLIEFQNCQLLLIGYFAVFFLFMYLPVGLLYSLLSNWLVSDRINVHLLLAQRIFKRCCKNFYQKVWQPSKLC